MATAAWRRNCLCVTLLAALAPGCNWVETQLRVRPKGPSVLFITIDTLRADHVGVYGAKVAKTPQLDSLAARGVVFEQAIASVPLTLPSHTSLHTGLYPPNHGVRHNGIFRAADELETVAEKFQGAGYRTGAVIAADVLAPEFGLAQGFDSYDADLPDHRATASGYYERTANQVTDRALAWLAESERPFFLWLHYYDAHANHQPPEPYATQYARHPYNGEVAFVDHEIGRLFAGLAQHGRLQDILVAVTSDHGEGLGQHGEGSHSYLIYDSVTHVPLIVAGPGVPSGVRVPEVVSNAGVAATLLALAGAPSLSRVDAGDLSPHWAQSAPRGGFAYSESLAGELDHGWSPIHGLRSDAFHYIRAPRPELFDSQRDPLEYHNLLEHTPMHPAQQAAEARLGPLLAGALPLARSEVDPEMRARIEALGYVVPAQAVAKNGADPKDVHHFADMGTQAMALMVEGRETEAARLAELALQKIPGSILLHDILARAYEKLGDPVSALQHAEVAARLRPDAEGHVAQLAYLQMKLGQLEAAATSYQRLEEIGRDGAESQIALMWSARLGRSPEEVEQYAKRAVELAGWRRDICERVAEVWEELGEYERAFEVYADALRRYPQDQRLHMRMAIQHARFGADAKSAEHLAKAGEEAHEIELRNRLAIAYAVRRDFSRAESLFRQSLVAAPERVATRRNLAKLLTETGRIEEAKAIVAGLPDSRAPEATERPPAAPQG